MLGPDGLLHDHQCSLVERLGLGVPALGLVDRRQAVEVYSHVQVLGLANK